MTFVVYTGFCGMSLRHSCAIIATIKILPLIPMAINVTNRSNAAYELWLLVFYGLTSTCLLTAVATQEKWFCIASLIDLIASSIAGIIIMVASILLACGLPILVPQDYIDVDFGIDIIKLLEILFILIFFIGLHIVVIHINVLRYVYSYFKELDQKDK